MAGGTDGGSEGVVATSPAERARTVDVVVVDSTALVPMESAGDDAAPHPNPALATTMATTTDLDNSGTDTSLPAPVRGMPRRRSLGQMTRDRRFHPVRLWRDYGIRLMRYGGVTVVSSTVGLTTLTIGIVVMGWPALFANFVSVLVSTPPAYLLNRHWVWGRDRGGHSVSREIGPFWIMTFLGWVVSSIAVGTADLFTDRDIILIGAQVASFGLLWLLKFAFLEKVMWRHLHHPAHPVTEQV